jgi:hypothetical protein
MIAPKKHLTRAKRCRGALWGRLTQSGCRIATPRLRAVCSLLMAGALTVPAEAFSQSPPAAQTHYKLTIVENAGKLKRVKKNRVSAEAVIKVTDENDVPVVGIGVTFTIPSLLSGGAAFSSGSLTSIVVTNAAGLASSGSFVAGASTFSMSVTAAVPGGAISATIPVNAAAALAAGGGAGGAGGAAGGAGAGTGTGVSTGLIVGIVAGVAAVGAVVAKVATGGKSTPPPPSATVGLGSGPAFGPPH